MAVVADIVKITAPLQATSGETVIVDVHVKNLALAPGGYSYIGVSGKYNSTNLSWQFDYLVVAPQETVVFRGWFTMPAERVTVNLASWYWDESLWQKDDTDSISVLIYPKADIANLVVVVSVGLEYPKADIANLVVVASGGLEYPKADIANLVIVASGGIAVDFENLVVTYKKT